MFPEADDVCDGDVSDIVKISGDFVPGGSCANEGTYTNTWTVTDDCGNVSETYTQVITIQDTKAPVWATASGELDATLQCSDLSDLSIAQGSAPEASDNCSDLELIKIPGDFVPNANCSYTGTYTNTWTAVDDCGNVSEVYTQVITIIDTEAPQWDTPLTSLDAEVECGDETGYNAAIELEPLALDNCDLDVILSAPTEELIPSVDCAVDHFLRHHRARVNILIAREIPRFPEIFKARADIGRLRAG